MLTDVYSKSRVSLRNTHVPTLALLKPAKVIISSNTAKLLFKKNEQPLLRTPMHIAPRRIRRFPTGDKKIFLSANRNLPQNANFNYSK